MQGLRGWVVHIGIALCNLGVGWAHKCVHWVSSFECVNSF